MQVGSQMWVRELRCHIPHSQKKETEKKRYCNKFNKEFKNGPHQKTILKSTAQEQSPCILAMTRQFEHRLQNQPAPFQPLSILTLVPPLLSIWKDGQGMWGADIRAASLKVLLMRGDSVFSPWEEKCDDRDHWLLLCRSFCRVSVEVARASRGRRDCGGPGKEETEESTSQFPLPLESIKEAHCLSCGCRKERGMRGSGAVSSEENLHPEEVGDHNPRWRRTPPSPLWVSPPTRGDPARAEHFSKTRPTPTFHVESTSLTGIRLNQAKVEGASPPALALNHAEMPPASPSLHLNLESQTQEREEQQNKRDNAAPSSGSLEPWSSWALRGRKSFESDTNEQF